MQGLTDPGKKPSKKSPPKKSRAPPHTLSHTLAHSCTSQTLSNPPRQQTHHTTRTHVCSLTHKNKFCTHLQTPTHTHLLLVSTPKQPHTHHRLTDSQTRTHTHTHTHTNSWTASCHKTETTCQKIRNSLAHKRTGACTHIVEKARSKRRDPPIRH